MIEKPYPPPLEPGVVACVVMARTATAFMADIEAHLVDQGMSATLAPTVAAMMDISGWNLPTAAHALKWLIDAYGEVP